MSLKQRKKDYLIPQMTIISYIAEEEIKVPYNIKKYPQESPAIGLNPKDVVHNHNQVIYNDDK